MSEGLIDLDSESFDSVVSDGKVLVDFWAPWCGPCKMLTPILERVKSELGDKVVIAKVNVDENPDLAAKFSVRSIPYLLVFEGGEVKETLVGLKQQKELIDILS